MITSLSPKQSRMVLASVMLGLFLGAMEATVVATALPTIVSKLSGLHLYSWPMAIYILAAAVSGPIFGKLSDLYGQKFLYLFSLTIFLIGSALCGFSQTMMQLVIFRAIQGLGAGGVLPLAIIIAGHMFPFEKRAKVQPVFSMVWGLASLIGPPLGSWLTLHDWRLVFFINIPFGILSGFLVLFFLHESKEEHVDKSIDYIGAILLAAGILVFELALPEEGGSLVHSWKFSGIAFSLILFTLLIFWERKAKNPILPLELLPHRMFSSATICQFFAGVALFGSLSFIPLYVQAVMGLGVAGAGKVLTFFLLIWVFFSALSARLMLRVGYRFLVLSGGVMLVLGFAVMSTLTANPSRFTLNLGLFLLGAGMGWIMAPLIVAVQSSIPKKFLGMATSSQVLFRTAGASIGVSVMGAVMTYRMHQSAIASSSARVLELFHDPNKILDPALRVQLPPDVLQSVSQSMAFSLHGVFIAAFVAAIFLAIAAYFVPGGKAEKHFHKEA